jgi:hypothetical protein
MECCALPCPFLDQIRTSSRSLHSPFMQREHNEFIAKLAGQQMDKIALDFHLLAFMVLFSLVLLMVWGFSISDTSVLSNPS